LADRGGWYRWEDDTLILSIRLQPRASCDEIVGPHGAESLKVRITAPPVDGKANQHLIKYLAKTFGVSKGQVTLLKGQSGRDKLLAITAPSRFPAGIDIGTAGSAASR
jgi:uncharacterized protein (TIGR00251 family)